jgi:phosphoribosyl-ATP pyrophosphohydrolase
MLLTVISVVFNGTIIVLGVTGAMSTGVMIASCASSIVFCFGSYLLFMFVLGVLTTFVEWDVIRGTTPQKIRYMFTFPLFMLTYVPIGIAAFFKKVGEEAVEVVIAASQRDRKATIQEIADLQYHLLVLMVDRGITIDDVEAELRSRRS